MFSNRQHYPNEILLTANLTDQTLQDAMEYLLSGAAQPGCKIMMGDNFITHPQLDVLLEALADERCPANVEIFLDYCHLTNAHAQKFSDLFLDGHYPANMRLHFHGNNIGDTGFLAMVHALSRDIERPSVYLNMQHNQQITNASLHNLAHLITIHEIADGIGFNLDNNPLLSDDVILRLIKSLQLNTAVVNLTVNINAIGLDEDDAMLMDGEMALLIHQKNLAYREMVQFCCDRNTLLQKYKHIPDLQYHIYALSEERGYKLAPALLDQCPSLTFFAARSALSRNYAAFAKSHPGGYEKVVDLTSAMAECQDKLGTYSPLRGCPWPCKIL